MRSESTDAREVFDYALAGLAPVFVGAALVGVRGELVGANLALILVLVIVGAAAVGGRGPAMVAAIMAAVSFDFFLTRPYLSLKIDSANDVETTVILLLIGLVVGQVAVQARRSNREARRSSGDIARLHRVAEQVANGASPQAVASSVCAELAAMLRLQDCRFEAPPTGDPLPRMGRNGAVAITVHRFVDGEFALPAEGVELPVLGYGRELGRLVLIPDPDIGIPTDECIVAVALADQLGAALTAANH